MLTVNVGAFGRYHSPLKLDKMEHLRDCYQCHQFLAILLPSQIKRSYFQCLFLFPFITHWASLIISMVCRRAHQVVYRKTHLNRVQRIMKLLINGFHHLLFAERQWLLDVLCFNNFCLREGFIAV